MEHMYSVLVYAAIQLQIALSHLIFKLFLFSQYSVTLH